MRIVILFFLLQVSLIHGQTSLASINLQKGTYAVGFKHYKLVDSTRTYQVRDRFNNDFIHRPIPISIWYPAKAPQEQTTQLTLLNYLTILKEEEEWENLPNEYLLQWFHYLWNTPENRAHLAEKANAYAKAGPVDQKFPVVVYAPSYQASSIENFALCEYLASHGYVVIASPSRGTNIRWLEGGTTKDLETQSRDVEFLLREIRKYENVDEKNIALAGFSYGGMANIVTAMKNRTIAAVVSLDGTERYSYEVLAKSPFFDLDKFAVPYIHFAQKKIPEQVLEEDNIPAELNYSYPLYDSLQYSNIYRYKFHHLSHSYFSSFGVLFGNRDKRKDKPDAEIMVSYRYLSEHVLQFLDATLKGSAPAKAFIERSPAESGYPEGLISKQMKKAVPKPFTYRDFMDLAYQQNFEDLIPLYQKTKQQHPDFNIPEVVLNKLGLHLSFSPSRPLAGIKVFELALHLYPNSANLYDSAGTSYFYNKQYKNAAQSYEKSLSLNPDNPHAIDKLKEIEQLKD
ncbi:MAG: prolyl oligopeptidase family serine peptidase [Bacteroidota bacterium]